MKRHVLPSLFLLLVSASAMAQTRAGGEFQVNTTTGREYLPSVALLPSGDFLVAWSDETGQDGSLFGIVARHYDASGAPSGPAFVVNTVTVGYQYGPSVSADPRGGFLVAWYTDDLTIEAQRYDRSGQRVGGQFRLAGAVSGQFLFSPEVAFDRAGNFVAVFGSTSDGDNHGIHAQRFDASGVRLGSEFLVNSYTTGSQHSTSVIRDPEGSFVVAWNSFGQEGFEVLALAQRFDAAGHRLGAEFHLGTAAVQRSPTLVATADGGFMATWGGSDGAFARRFDAAGSPIAPEFRVNQEPTGLVFSAGATGDATGDMVMAWTTSPSGPEAREVKAARFSATGQRRGGEFLVNTYTTGDQYLTRGVPTLSADSAGNFVVVWSSEGLDESVGVFAQRYGGLLAASLAVDQDPGHDGVLEPGETVSVRPSWRNVNGAPQSVSGTLTSLTGPAGATYTIVDGSGSYGTLANGATAQCTDCYSVAVSAPATRPATHWDAVAEEALAPDAQGQVKRWPLHIGGSFTDVPPASAFHRFVETLLHRGVTAGCSADHYCPALTVTREQMAVFVLVSKEGAAYLPPACTAPSLFADVPETSPFCRWVEELARRGVVSGCGASLFCPADAVSREQMAVFLLRTLDGALSPPACAPPNIFADVPETNGFCRWIEELSRRGITGGCGGGNYCPAAPVARDQMAVFLTTTFGLTLYGS